MFSAKNGNLKMNGTDMDYIRFGNGDQALIILPGLGDGLRTVKGTALPMAAMYQIFGKQYTVYAFSRVNGLSQGYTTRAMAADVAAAMDLLQIPKADIFGVSMGGMIAQFLAIDYPEKVGKLVLTVTSAKPNPILTESVEEWVSFAKKGDHTSLMDSNVRRIYSEDYYRRNKWMVPAMGRLTKPGSYDRFFIQANACLTHNAYEMLERIQSPALVIGGEKDLALGGNGSREIAERIPNAELLMYPQWGHGLYEEEKTFNQTVLSFLCG